MTFNSLSKMADMQKRKTKNIHMNRLIKLFILISIFSKMDAFAQSATQTEILNLSKDKFRWKTEGKIDSVADLFDDDLVFVHLNGHISSKDEWIKELKSRRFIYNTIDLKEASVKVYGTTAVLVGKATFKVTINGAKGTYNLVYTEVYTKKNNKWKLVNLHTCSNSGF